MWCSVLCVFVFFGARESAHEGGREKRERMSERDRWRGREGQGGGRKDARWQGRGGCTPGRQVAGKGEQCDRELNYHDGGVDQ